MVDNPERSAALGSADFALYLHGTFQVHYGGSQPLPFELIEVLVMRGPDHSNRRQPFSLIFLGPKSERYLVQHVYRFEHESLGTLDIFIVPLGPDKTDRERMQYQAIFS